MLDTIKQETANEIVDGRDYKALASRLAARLVTNFMVDAGFMPFSALNSDTSCISKLEPLLTGLIFAIDQETDSSGILARFRALLIEAGRLSEKA